MTRTGFRMTIPCGFLLICTSMATAQFHTPTLNGTPFSPPGKFGSEEQGENMITTHTGQNWYMTWNNEFLYVGITNANLAEGAVLYIDANPIVPVNGGDDSDGSLVSFVYDSTGFSPMPFRADFVTYFKNDYREFRRSDGNGGWTGQVTGFGAYAHTGPGGSDRELAIPWNAITDGAGRPTAFNWFGYVTSSSGHVYAAVPTTRIADLSIGTQFRDPWYFTVDSTEDGASTLPFSQVSYTFVHTSSTQFSDPSLPAGFLTDFTLNRPGVFVELSTDNPVHSLRDLVVGAGEFRLGSRTTPFPVNRDVRILGGQLTLGTAFGGDLRVFRDLELGDGGVLASNNRQVEFRGPLPSTISGDFVGSNRFEFLALNKSGGAPVGLDDDIDVGVRLWLQSGILETNGKAVHVEWSGTDTLNTGVRREFGTDSGFVRGALKRTVGLAGGERLFPVGTDVAAPLTVEFDFLGPSQAAMVTVSTSEGTVAPFDEENMVARTWQVDVDGSLGTYNARLLFRYAPGDVGGGINQSQLRAAKQFSPTSFYPHASNWLSPNPAVQLADFSVRGVREDVSLGGLWILTTAPDPVLRVDLLSFTATSAGIGSPVVLEWETAAEFLNAGFNLYQEVEPEALRRLNAYPIPALGHEFEGATYAFTHAQPMAPGEVRSYILEDVEYSGLRTKHGPVTVGPFEGTASTVDEWSLY